MWGHAHLPRWQGPGPRLLTAPAEYSPVRYMQFSSTFMLEKRLKD